MNILIVDDAELIRDLFKNMFLIVDQEFNVVNLIRSAESSHEVESLLDKDSNVDLIILDFNLRNETAIDVLRIIRSKNEMLVKKTIIISGRDIEEIQKELFSDDFLIPIYSKPISLEFITTILQEYKSFDGGAF